MSTPPPKPGAALTPEGARITMRSTHATRAFAVLQDPAGERVLPMERAAEDTWSVLVPGVTAGQRYALRVDGAHDPAHGLLFDVTRRLIDPYARAIDGDWAVLVDPPADPGTGTAPRTPWADTVIYEAHVRGLTRQHPEVPPPLRGTYAGLAHPAVTAELVALGVTAIQLMPVHEFRSEPAVLARGLVNYWGYSTLGFFAPHAAYSSAGAGGEQVTEFRAMVAAMHAAGIEVILDVVFNHTCEGGPGQDAVCLRGIDNPGYYWLNPADPGGYVDVTGCGNTVDPESSLARSLVMDSLRYWVTEMGVDGFRFDLAVALGRRRTGFAHDAPLLAAIATDPVLEGVKRIAEPWDLGPGGYAVGGFPAPFADHNGVFRDEVRDLWRGQSTIGVLAGKLAGSEDVYGPSGRGPLGAVNLITAHDGFTLADLVSFNGKHNQGNLEDNRDGADDNRSWNSGVEGPTADPQTLEVRDRRARGLMATLLLSAGVPMLLAGDERGRTQGGNNNGYCQDNEVSWTDWTTDERRAAMRAFTGRLTALRREEPLLRRAEFLSDADVSWLGPDGEHPDQEAWNGGEHRVLAMLLHGESLRPARPDLLVVVNVGPEARTVALPEGSYRELLDSARPDGEPAPDPLAGTITAGAWSVRVMRRAG
ncbi:MAG: glycogen debranching protein GlgX [Thermoleophilia bacterium]